MENLSLEEQLELYESSAAVVFTCEPDAEFTSTFFSPGVTTQLGWEPSDFLNNPGFWPSHVHPDDKERVIAGLSELFENDHHSHEYRFQHKDGSYRWMSDVLRLERDASGEPARIVGYWTDITERHQAEQAFTESHDQLRLVTDSLPALITYIDAEQRYRFANKTACEWHARPVEEILGKTAAEVHGQGYEKLRSRIDRALAGEQVNYDDSITLSDGVTRTTRATFVPHRGPAGKVVGFFALVEDITEMKQAEDALRESEARFRGVVENLPVSLTLKDSEDRFQFVNPRFGEWFGLQPEDVIGRTSYDVFPNYSLDAASSLDRKVMETGQTQELDRDVQFSDGTLHSLALTKFPVTGADDEIIGVGTINSDITERKRTESELLESRDQLRQITDNLPEWITYIDAQQRYRFVNKTAAEWLARPVEEIVGKTISEIMGQEYEKIRSGIDRVLAGEQQAYIGAVDFPDGMTRTLQATYVPHTGADGNVEGYFALAVDISELQKTEELLRQAQKMEAVGQLTGGVAHDFNNLLAVVVGNLELAADHLQVGTPVFDYVRNAFNAADRGASLTQHLLAFARQQVLQPEEINLAKLISETKELMAVSMGERVTVKLQTDDDLWLCKVDQAQLQNAILNMSINARDAMPSGGNVIIRAENVRLDAGRAEAFELDEGDYVCLSVSDNGPGMPYDVLEHVFEPFYTTKGVGEGSGLGLSMVYGFVQQSGGAVDIETAEGEGTTVRLYFPAVVSATVATIEDAAQPQADLSEPDATILLVEDNAAFREVTRTILETLNFRVIDFGSAEEALTVVGGTTPFDLLLSDIGLPGEMDGHELAECATSARPGLKVVLMSAHAGRGGNGGIIDHNVAAFLPKPHHRADLTKTLHRVLELDTLAT